MSNEHELRMENYESRKMEKEKEKKKTKRKKNGNNQLFSRSIVFFVESLPKESTFSDYFLLSLQKIEQKPFSLNPEQFLNLKTTKTIK